MYNLPANAQAALNVTETFSRYRAVNRDLEAASSISEIAKGSASPSRRHLNLKGVLSQGRTLWYSRAKKLRRS
jgi:hypothetical protein